VTGRAGGPFETIDWKTYRAGRSLLILVEAPARAMNDPHKNRTGAVVLDGSSPSAGTGRYCKTLAAPTRRASPLNGFLNVLLAR
jgi:hypothetical protein